jgi:pimeloyl-ACP methyl ester carboxylesterase
MSAAGPAEHITPYDRIALDEPTMIALLAAPARHEALVDYFGAALHAELVKLARASQRVATGARPRVYVLPGIMGTQLGFVRGGEKPNDVLWLDPIDFNFGRLRELKLPGDPALRALGAMSYTYLKLALSLRTQGFDAVLVDYDWRHDVASVGRALAQRIEADGCERVALVGHSMGGLVARAAMTHAAGARVSRLVMLGTPNSGSLAAIQALRGTYSVVRKLAMLDLKHEAEYLASEVFSTFPGLHELLPSGDRAGPLDLFDARTWPSPGPGPDATLLRAARGLASRLAPADHRFHAVVGCNRITATRVTLRDGDFVYEYSRRGDGTVPMELARLEGADNRYVDCGHSDMPLSDRVIAGTIDLLATGRTRRFSATPKIRDASRARVRDAELRREYQGKVDWPQMSSGERREFLDTLNEPPRRMREAGSGGGPKRLPKKRLRRPAPRRKK